MLTVGSNLTIRGRPTEDSSEMNIFLLHDWHRDDQYKNEISKNEYKINYYFSSGRTHFVRQSAQSLLECLLVPGKIWIATFAGQLTVT